MHIQDDDFVLHYYGEMSDADEAGVLSHLSTCGQCAESYRRLQRVLTVVEGAAVAEPAEGFERTVWARLEPNLDAGDRARGWRGYLLLSPAHLAFAATVVVLVAAAFFAGQLFPREADRGAAISVTAEAVRERILLVDLGDHLDRSQMVLVEVVSADDEGTLDMSVGRARAVELVAANRLYRQTALRSGEPQIAALLDELERVLVDVAASPDQMDAADLESMRRRIDSRGLLFKVRVVSSEVRDRQKSTRALLAPSS